MAKRARKGPVPPFTLRRCGSSTNDLKAVETKWQPALKQHLRDLAKRGCEAAGYALSGPPPWNAMCSTHIGPYRVIICFPAQDVVAIFKVAKHDDHTDPYAELAAEIGLAISTEPRTKPACCDGAPPVDENLGDSADRHAAQLTRSQRKQVSRRQ